uniref:Uncharacterized protein n=1 Tax=Schizaphis graminum TaxID=13262 RepID=A0A2S2PTC5_SCHGA
MAVGCKLWLLAVVYVAFLYQDGPQGNGVLCARKPVPESDEDQSFGAVSSDDGNDEQDDDNDDQSDSGNNSDGDYTGNNRKRFSGDDDDNDDDVDADVDADVYADKESNSDEEEVHGKNSKKHAANKKLDRSKNYHRHRDDDEDEKADEDGDREDDEEDREHHVKIMKNNTNYDAELTEMKILTTTTVTGKPKDILKFLNEGVKPYKPAALDFNKKLNSSLFKKIDAITKRSSTSSKSKKETSEEDLTHYIRNIVREGTKKKISKQVDTDKVRILNYHLISRKMMLHNYILYVMRIMPTPIRRY